MGLARGSLAKAVELEVPADLTSRTCLGLDCLGLVAKLGDGGAKFSQLIDLSFEVDQACV